MSSTVSRLGKTRQGQIYNPVTMASTDNVKAISWLIGTWKSSKATATFPTMEPFEYQEEVTFTHVGQPMLNYSSSALNPKNDKPMHKETGFLRVKPGTNELALMCAQNIGIVVIEEGTITDNEISLESKALGRMSFASDPQTTEITRKFKLVDSETLEQTVSMATSKTSLTPHLHVLYKKDTA